jgi:hypothetical protein
LWKRILTHPWFPFGIFSATVAVVYARAYIKGLKREYNFTFCT